MANVEYPFAALEMAEAQTAARALGLDAATFEIRRAEDIAPAFEGGGYCRRSAFGRFCCKSPQLPGANFFAVKKSDRRSPIDVAPITLPRSPVSLSSGDEVHHIFTRKSRLRPKNYLIASAKRLLQQNLPTADSCTAANGPLIQ
jgi:hypothetical protein